MICQFELPGDLRVRGGVNVYRRVVLGRLHLNQSGETGMSQVTTRLALWENNLGCICNATFPMFNSHCWHVVAGSMSEDRLCYWFHPHTNLLLTHP